MAVHTVDTDELKALGSTLDDYVAYLTTFEAQAMGHGNALLGAWSGRASREFIGELVAWAVGARLLITQVQGMAEWATAASGAYAGAVEAAKEVTGS